MSFELVMWLLAIVFALYVWFRFLGSVTIYEYQKGLLYKNGSFKKVLNAGKYYYLRSRSDIKIVDIRKFLFNLPGQAILTKDNVNVKFSLVGSYEVTDPALAKHSSNNYELEFYNGAQLILRDLVGKVTIDELLEDKGKIDNQLVEHVGAKAEELGLKLSSIAVKDIMLPANLKRAFSSILEAKKDAQCELEKARGEQAVLRNLANSSNMYENNPGLLQARLIQALSTGKHTIVFNGDEKKLAVQD